MAQRPSFPILLALVAALFLRALVPTGWMPTPTGGPFAIQPCPAADLTAAAGHQHHRSNGQHDGDCAFAPLLAGFVPAADVPAIEPPAAASSAPFQHSLTATFPTGPPAAPPPATGPPALA
jgi:hypothetical protein